MEKFYLEIPSIVKKQDAIAFIKECRGLNSAANGTEKPQKLLDDCQYWLDNLQMGHSSTASGANTYFLIRSSDSRIVGIINIEPAISGQFRHRIRCCIRPSERGKGYGKINLYFGLKACREHGIDTILIGDGPALWEAAEDFGGAPAKEFSGDENTPPTVKNYEIDVKESILRYSPIYEPMVEHITVRPYRDSDYAFVYEVKKSVYQKYVEECWGLWIEENQQKYFEKFISQAKGGAYIIQYANKDIGFYNGETAKTGSYEIGNICIIPEYQGRGIGARILKGVLEKYAGADIGLQYFKQNPVGSLYEKLGFKKCGETNFHYQMVKPKA